MLDKVGTSEGRYRERMGRSNTSLRQQFDASGM